MKNQKVHNLGGIGSSVKNDRPKITKQNFGMISPVSLSSKMSKYKHGSHSKNSSQSNSQHPIFSNASINTKHEKITSSYNTSLNSNLFCTEVQDTTDTDNLINPSDKEETYTSDKNSILPSKLNIKKQAKKILHKYDTHKGYQTTKQLGSSDKTKLDRHTKNNKNYNNDEKTIKNDNHYTQNIDFDLNDMLHSSNCFSKVVDIPSAGRLAKHLFYLEGFKNNDVSYHLSKK